MPSVMFDAVLVPGGAQRAEALSRNGDAVHFVLEAYKHCKAICTVGEGVELLRRWASVRGGRRGRPGVVIGKNDPPGRAATGAGIHRRDGASPPLVAAQRRSSPRLIPHQGPCCNAA